MEKDNDVELTPETYTAEPSATTALRILPILQGSLQLHAALETVPLARDGSRTIRDVALADCQKLAYRVASLLGEELPK